MTPIDHRTHGGDAERVARRLGIPPEGLLDFSANVNPLGLPARAAARLAREACDPRMAARYPDPETPELRSLLSGRLDLPEDCIVIGAGAGSLIHQAVRALTPRRCLIPVPAFSEYARACVAYGCAVHSIPLNTEAQCSPGDLIVLNNPHNPTGACASRTEMLRRVAGARSAGAAVLLDEAFIDYAPDCAITGDAAAQPGVIAIRSLTKFFGCPGLRVGYAVAAAETARALAAQLPPWPVSVLALNALAEALRDGDYARETLERNQRARERLSEALGHLGCQVFPSAANFLLLRLADGFAAAHVRERLIREHGVLVRDCDGFEGLEPGRFLRVAVRLESENVRLVEALERVFQAQKAAQAPRPVLPGALLEAALQNIRPVDSAWIDQARMRQLQLTKPPGSLGRLEEIANRMAGIQATLSPSVERARIILFAADHGVCAEGVSPYPQAVTAQMVANFLRGGAAINSLARVAGVELEIVDAGVACELPGTAGLIRRAIARGANNFCREPAMSREQAVAALSLGIEMAQRAVSEGCTLLGMGEMGIANTTVASALTAALTGLAPASVIGRGTGADDACMARKRSAVERALALHMDHIREPLDLLARLGGFEIDALCGLCLGAAANRCAVLVDGFIATAAAALATRFSGSVRDYLFAAHRSTEPGHAPLLELIGQRPLLDLDMRLGEGTGAALAVPVVRAAVAAFIAMATFASAGVAEAAAEPAPCEAAAETAASEKGTAP